MNCFFTDFLRNVDNHTILFYNAESNYHTYLLQIQSGKLIYFQGFVLEETEDGFIPLSMVIDFDLLSLEYFYGIKAQMSDYVDYYMNLLGVNNSTSKLECRNVMKLSQKVFQAPV